MSKKLLLVISAACILTMLVSGLALAKVKAPAKWDMETDVLVLGFGAAGATAAVTAFDAGSDVLILEKMPFPGGNTAVCGGAIYGTGTDIQKALGYNDSPEQFIKYYSQIKPGMNFPEFIELLAHESADAVQFVIDNGAKIPLKEGTPGITMGGFERNYAHVTPPMPRSHWVEGGGKGLFQAFYNAVKDRSGIKVSLSTAAERLIQDPQTERIIGVQAKKGNKTIYVKARKGVVLATGGYSQNKEMLTQFVPGGNNYKGAKGSPAVVGDGMKMAQEVGADLWAMHEALESMGIAGYPNTYFTPFMEYTLIVNNNGVRYISEGAWTEPISEATIQQPNGEGYLIWDDALNSRSEFSTTIGSVVPAERVVKANSIKELAEKLGLPVDAVQKTVAEYNGFCKTGVDPMGKTPAELFALDKAPFYAIKSDPLPVMSTGGVLTDTEARVLTPFKDVIPGLYAAGEVTGGKLIGYPGCGSAVSEAFVFGRIAGDNAARESAWDK